MNIVIATRNDGRRVLLMVLEPGNLHLLNQGKPIDIHLDDYFPDGIPRKLDLGILYSETPVADSREFAKLSEMVLDERAPRLAKRPHCPHCKSTLEQLGCQRNDSPIALVFCPMCGATLGTVPHELVAGITEKL